MAFHSNERKRSYFRATERQMFRCVRPRGEILKTSNPFLPRNVALIGEQTVQLTFLSNIHSFCCLFRKIEAAATFGVI